MAAVQSRERTRPPQPYGVLKKDGSVRRGREPEIDRALLLRIYRYMVLLRLLDERMLVLQRQGRIGFWGPTTGQEAGTIASVAALEERDWVFPALREAGAALWRGLPLVEMVAQCMGNARDRCHGRQMPCHYTFREGRYVSMSSVIGTQIPHAVGAAMAARIRGDDVVTIGYLGDGATSSSDFHVAMNFAGVFRAPCVLLCQNNQWAISVPVERQCAASSLVDKAAGYGMPGERVDGNDALAVYARVRAAVARARRGGGPTFLELVTYRLLGHSSSDDPGRYRDEGEVERWRERDPIVRLRAHLEHRGWWDETREEGLRDELHSEIGAAIREAEMAPPPPLETLVQDVYREPTPQLLEQLEGVRSGLEG